MTPTRLALATLLMAAAPAALANTSQVNVTGTITPASCQITFVNGGTFDLGQIKAMDLDSTRETRLPTESTGFSIDCDAAMRFAISTIDAHEADNPNAAPEWFSLGTTANGEVIGRFSSSVKAPLAGTDTLYWTRSTDAGATWTASSANYDSTAFSRGDVLYGWTTAEGSNAGPVPIQQFAATLELEPYIAAVSGLTLRDDQSINGGMVLTVKFL